MPESLGFGANHMGRQAKRLSPGVVKRWSAWGSMLVCVACSTTASQRGSPAGSPSVEPASAPACCTPGGAPGEVAGTNCRVCPTPTCTNADGERPGVDCVMPAAPEPCTKDGELIEGKDARAHCCTRAQGSLTNRIALEQPAESAADPAADERGCVSQGPPSVLVCSPCGNSVCEPWENRCNCAEDCSPPQ